MDKYEFNFKMEQLKKLIHEEDYSTALKIVDSIDWNRVRNTNLLTMAATVYEKNGRLGYAKEILLRALDRAPVGKRILYKLVEIAVEMKSLEEAEDYYYEFRQADPKDLGNYILQYMILKARNAPYDRQIQVLELYCEADPDEKWLYELVLAYEKAGMTQDCVRTCDRIALLYGDSDYAVKALNVKKNYANLSMEQQALMSKRSNVPPMYGSYDQRTFSGGGYGQDAYPNGNPAKNTYARGTDIAANERYGGDTYGGAGAPAKNDMYQQYGLMEEPDISTVSALRQESVEEYEDRNADADAAVRNSDALAAARYADEDAYFEAYVRKLEQNEREAAQAQPVRQTVFVDAARAAETVREPVRVENTAYTGPEPADRTAGANTSSADESFAAGNPDAVSDEGTQMAFDFGTGAPKVVEKPEEDLSAEEKSIQPDSNGAQEVIGAIGSAAADTANAGLKAAAISDAVSMTAGAMAAAGAGAGISMAGGSAIAAVEAALNGTAERAAAARDEDLRQPAQKAFSISGESVNPQMTANEGDTFKRTAQVMSGTDIQGKPADTERPKAAPAPDQKFHMIIEAKTVQEGINIAVDELKRIHDTYGLTNTVSKTTAEKLNEIGLTDAVIAKVRGRDLVIECAGKLKKEMIEELYDFIRFDQSGTNVILIDTPEGLDKIEDVRPEFFDVCDYVSDINDKEYAETAGKNAETYQEDEYIDEPYEDEDIDDDYDVDEPYEDEEEPDRGEYEPKDRYTEKKSSSKKRSIGKVKEKFSNVKNIEPEDSDSEMEIDDFAQYCTQYATSIDCSITGKSMLALYERIELMEEEGIPLTKKSAEDLIEEAADKAEKPPIGKRISGMFQSKYDKNGCLILKEDDFI